MTKLRSALLVWIWLISTAALPAADSGRSGFAASENFTVLTPRQATAQQANEYAAGVLRAAELLRSEIAREWCGEELPESQGRTIVTVSFEPDRDVGLTWAIDDPRRKYHSLVLATSPELALKNTLAHEMVHVVLATRFPHPNRLPIWLEEGIASRYDDDTPKYERQQQIITFNQTRRWPRIRDVLAAKTFRATDTQSYTVATSVTALLLARDGDKQKLLEFGQYGNRYGWDTALLKYYDIPSVETLQTIWQQTLKNDGEYR